MEKRPGTLRMICYLSFRSENVSVHSPHKWQSLGSFTHTF